MSRESADVVIVGAGPAGSTLALLLARAGADVLLLDRAHFPRAKPCGDCLSAAATRVLARLELLPAVLALEPAELLGWRIHGPRQACFAARFDEVGQEDALVQRALAVRRSELDALLLNAARAAGARVHTGLSVTDLVLERDAVAGVHARGDDGQVDVRARLTVGADGLRSRVSRRLGAVARPARVRKLSLTTHVFGEWELGGYGEMHVARDLCAGLAPVHARSGVHNLTLVADATRYGADVRTDPHAFFTRALRQFPALRAREIRPAELLASGPFDTPVRATVFDGAALVGDAAGYFDPFTGQGVYQAMAGAELLAPVALRALRATSAPQVPARALDAYARAHRALVRGPRRVQRLIDAVLSRPALAERAIAGIARRPPVARAILAVTGDLWPARALLSTALLAALLSPRPTADVA